MHFVGPTRRFLLGGGMSTCRGVICGRLAVAMALCLLADPRRGQAQQAPPPEVPPPPTEVQAPTTEEPSVETQAPPEEEAAAGDETATPEQAEGGEAATPEPEQAPESALPSAAQPEPASPAPPEPEQPEPPPPPEPAVPPSDVEKPAERHDLRQRRGSWLDQDDDDAGPAWNAAVVWGQGLSLATLDRSATLSYNPQ
jgi:hypothetical protein